MITKFVSSGILGIPDLELEFEEDEKLIVIKGPNGSGKTSLLKQITHPFSSHDRTNRLRDGVDEGHTVMILKFRNKEYKIQHLYQRDRKNAIKVNSYLAKKVDGSWVELVENGLPTTFAGIVLQELDYEKYLYDILNIGVSNKSLVDFTNADRIEYLKKILKLESLNTIKETILEKLKEASNNYKYVQNKLSKYIPMEKMIEEIKRLEHETLTINNDINFKNSELKKLNIDASGIDEWYNRIRVCDENVSDLEKAYSILKDIDYNTNIDNVINDIKNNIATSQAKINQYNEAMDTLHAELISMKDIDNEKLTNEVNDYNIRIQNILDKYTDKEYIKIKLDDLIEVKNYTYFIKSTIEETGCNIIDLRVAIKNNKNNLVAESEDKIRQLVNEITEHENMLSTLALSTDLVKGYIPKECTIKSCPLAKEYERQVSEVDIFNNTKELISLKNKTLNELRESHDSIIILEKAKKIIENKPKPAKLGLFHESSFESLIDINAIDLLINTLTNTEFYLRDMKDKKDLEDKLEKAEMLLALENSKGSERKKYIMEDLSNYDIQIKKEKENLLHYQNDFNRYDMKFNNLNNATVNRDDTLASIDSYKNTIQEVNEKINDVRFKQDTKKAIEQEIETLTARLQRNTEEFYNIKNDAKESNSLNKEFTRLGQDIEKLKILKDVVSSKLPGRILGTYLDDVSNHVNSLLEDFLTIRFDVTDGVDLIVNRDGIERTSSNLSQGEKSILACVLLLAFKKNIPWDIISLDEIDATLDEGNKSKFLYMIRDYSETVHNLNQIFIVSHAEFNDDGLGCKIINL